MLGRGINSCQWGNYNPSFLADVTLEDVRAACDKGAFRIDLQESKDGSKHIVLYGTGRFEHCIFYRLHVCPEGRVYFDGLYYTSTVRDKRKIPLLIRDFETLVKLWMKA